MDLCRLNRSQCLNNGTCVMNYSSNTAYCLCTQCHVGNFCENILSQQNQYNTDYIYLIIYIVGLCIAVLNNSICLELFIRCKSIRRTNCGVYLIIYSILSLLASSLKLANSVVVYDKSIFNGVRASRERFECIVEKVCSNAAAFLCIWFSACIQLEWSFVFYFNATTRNCTPLRSVVIPAILFVMAIGCGLPVAFYNCEWDNVPHFKVARVLLPAFHITVAILIYIVSIHLSFAGFTRRIHTYGMEKNSFLRTFVTLSWKHFFIFIPAIVYITCYVPFQIVTHLKKPGTRYLRCGISTPEYNTKVLLQALMGVPFAITWLIFVYPSSVYMTEFYMNTWCGHWAARIVLLFRRFTHRVQN